MIPRQCYSAYVLCCFLAVTSSTGIAHDIGREKRAEELLDCGRSYNSARAEIEEKGEQVGRARDRREKIERKKHETEERYGKEEKGERFVWGPGDVEVTYSPSGEYPPGQRHPVKENPEDGSPRPKPRDTGRS